MSFISTPNSHYLRRAAPLTAAVIASLAISACAFKTEEPPKPQPTTDAVIDKLQTEQAKEAANGQLEIKNVSVRFEPNPTPGSYQMIVTWPNSIPNMSISINNKAALMFYNKSSASIPVTSSEKLTLSLTAYGTLSATPLSNLTIDKQVPTDAVFEKETVLVEDTHLKAERVFFRENGSIRTNGFHLSIETVKLLLQKPPPQMGKPFLEVADISTFTANDKAQPSSDLNSILVARRLSNSMISIKAVEATGSLRIAMLGVKGLAGASGLEIEAAQPSGKVPSRTVRPGPLPGTAGRDGVESEEIGRCPTGRSEQRDCQSKMKCSVLPSSGLNSPKGPPGEKGGIGGKGGAAGSLLILVKNSQDLKIEVRHRAGAGGAGGEGAPGHLAAEGGKAGDRPGLCSAIEVHNGGSGPNGDKGANGDEGSVGDSVSIGGNVVIEAKPLE